MDSFVFHIGIKIPGIVSDAIIGVLLFLCFAAFQKKKWGLFAVLAYAIHPASIYDTAVWGQADALLVVFFIACLLCVLRKFWLLAGIFFGLSLLAKAQAVMFAPLLLAMVIPYRKPLLWSTLGVLGTIGIVVLPFFVEGSGEQVLAVYTKAVGYYPTLASGAYNLWWALFADEVGNVSVQKLMFGLVSYRAISLSIFCLLYAGILATFRNHLWPWGGKPTVRVMELLPIAALIAHAFFTFNVEMHERYLYPYVALGIPLLFLNWKTATVYVLTSLAFLINLLGVLPYGRIDKMLFSEFPLMDAFIGSAHVFLFFLGWLFLYEALQVKIPEPQKKKVVNTQVRKKTV